MSSKSSEKSEKHCSKLSRTSSGVLRLLRAHMLVHFASPFVHTMKVKLSWSLRRRQQSEERNGMGAKPEKQTRCQVRFKLLQHEAVNFFLSFAVSRSERRDKLRGEASTSFSQTRSSFGWQMKCQSKGIFCYFFNFFFFFHSISFPPRRARCDKRCRAKSKAKKNPDETFFCCFLLSRNNLIRQWEGERRSRNPKSIELKNRRTFCALCIRSLPRQWSNQEVWALSWAINALCVGFIIHVREARRREQKASNFCNLTCHCLSLSLNFGSILRTFNEKW
jgi:hypothetical protein